MHRLIASNHATKLLEVRLSGTQRCATNGTPWWKPMDHARRLSSKKPDSQLSSSRFFILGNWISNLNSQKNQQLNYQLQKQRSLSLIYSHYQTRHITSTQTEVFSSKAKQPSTKFLPHTITVPSNRFDQQKKESYPWLNCTPWLDIAKYSDRHVLESSPWQTRHSQDAMTEQNCDSIDRQDTFSEPEPAVISSNWPTMHSLHVGLVVEAVDKHWSACLIKASQLSSSPSCSNGLDIFFDKNLHTATLDEHGVVRSAICHRICISESIRPKFGTVRVQS